ncbi:MAG: cytochrome c biogenesis protein CcdA [Actinomycetota bacterium]
MLHVRQLVFALLLLGLFAPPALAAPGSKVTWKAYLSPADARAGEGAQVVVEAAIEKPWHIYSTKPPVGAGPRPTTLELAPNKSLTAEGKVIQPAPHLIFDEGFKKELEEYPGAVAFGIPVKIAAGVTGAQTLVVKTRHQACQAGMCLPPRSEDVTLTFTPAAGAARPDRLQAVTTIPKQPAGYEPPDEKGAANAGGAIARTTGAASPPDETIDDKIKRTQKEGLLSFLLFSISMGLLALLTPCVFPMVPITVSFFAKQQETSPGGGIQSAVAYCMGIIGTFTALGVATSLLFGAGSISKFATHPIVNLGLAVLFIVMAVNLFGGFEIMLPSWLVERSQSGTQKAGLAGPLLMGLTFSLTSFTCTVAFVGTLLAATTQGNFIWPIVGMLGFSTAFAMPFFLLALFPGWLAKLPKSGGWLVTVKAFMGFLELAAALKFLSNADLVWNLGLISRPVFLAICFAIFATAGAYMMGWLKLPHDMGGRVGVIRRGFGVATIVAAIYCLAGINGRSLGDFAAYLPPADYVTGANASGAHGGVTWLQNYEEALKQAEAEQKPIFIDFTGVTCTNCRLMEDQVFRKPEVVEELKKFVTVQLYTDKDTPESRRYQELQLKRFNQITLPLYVVQTPAEEKLGEYSFNTSVPAFLEFLRKSRESQQVAGVPSE